MVHEIKNSIAMNSTPSIDFLFSSSSPATVGLPDENLHPSHRPIHPSQTPLDTNRNILSNFPCVTANPQRKTTYMNTPSLRFRPLAAAILCSLLAPALFAQTATTTPVGFITATIPAAADASTPSNTTVSIPLYATADYVSTVASLDSANQFTLTGATWTLDQFASPTAPRLVRVKTSTTAAHVGKFFLVSGNSTIGQLTVTLPAGVANVNTVVSVGDSCEIVPANTLKTVFGVPSVLQVGATPTSADNVLVWGGSSWLTYFYSSAGFWKLSGAGATNQDSTVLYPDEGVFVIRKQLSPVTLTLMGTVPSTAEQTTITGAGSTFFSNRFPTDTNIATLALQTTANWTPGATPTNADKLFLWNTTSASWDTYYFSGSIWKRSGGGSTDQGAVAIPAGTAIFVTRNVAGDSSLSQALPYTP